MLDVGVQPECCGTEGNGIDLDWSLVCVVLLIYSMCVCVCACGCSPGLLLFARGVLYLQSDACH